MSNLAASPQAYRQGAVLAATRGQLVVMLYDGARRFLRQAAVAMRAGEIERAHNTLRRAELIIAHLDGTLDFDQGELAAAPARDLRVLPRATSTRARMAPGRRQGGGGQRPARRAARGLGAGRRGGTRARERAGSAGSSSRPTRRSSSTPSSNSSSPGSGDVDGLRALASAGTSWSPSCPTRPPPAAAPLLERARLIHERTRIELMRLREALLARPRHRRARRAAPADGYAGAAGAAAPRARPQRLSRSRSAVTPPKDRGAPADHGAALDGRCERPQGERRFQPREGGKADSSPWLSSTRPSSCSRLRCAAPGSARRR